MRRWQLWIALLVVLWITGVIAFYYVVHRPWAGDQAVVLLQVGRDLLIPLALVALAGGLGRKLCSIAPLSIILETAAPLERLAISAAVGLGFLSLAVLVAGLLGGLLLWVALAALLVGLVLLHRQIIAWAADLRGLAGEESLNGLEKLAGAFVALVFVLNLLRALAPPLKWDSLVYHLQVPQAYLAAGKIFFYPENFYAGFPQTVEVLFTWAMAFGRASTAAVFGWTVSVLAFLGVEGFSRRLLGQGTRWLAPAVLLSGYSISQAMNWAYLELWVLLFGTLMLLALDYYLRSSQRAWLLFAGIVLGFAISIKYTAGVLLVMAGVMLLVRGPNPKGSKAKPFGFRRWIFEMLTIGGVAAMLVLPWLLKNLILMGNPLYPLWMPGDQIDPWQQAFHSGSPPQRSLVEDLLLPFEATFFGIEGGKIEGTPEYGASLGPFLLALIPGLLLGWRSWGDSQQRTLRQLLAVAACTWLLWSVAAHFADELMRPRHWLGIFGALAVLAVAGFQSASTMHFPALRLGRVLSALVILGLVLAALNEVVEFSRANPLPVVLGSQSQDDYLDQQLGWYSPAVRAVNQLPKDATVLFLWEPRTLYCQVTCLLDGKLENWWYLHQAGGDSAGVAGVLAAKGVTHVLLNDAGFGWIKRVSIEADTASWIELESVLESFKQDHLRLLQRFGDYYSLYVFESGG